MRSWFKAALVAEDRFVVTRKGVVLKRTWRVLTWQQRLQAWLYFRAMRIKERAFQTRALWLD